MTAESVPAPPRRMPAAADARETTDRTSTVPARVDRWQRALLDMTYTNPLLKLRKTNTAVHVPVGGLARLEDQVSDRRRIRLVPHDELAEIHHAQGARTAADIEAAALLRIMDEEKTLFVALNSREYGTRLRNLQRKARTTLEGTGTDSLYLSLGTLEWSERSREGRAPLFLAPVKLLGGRGDTPFLIELDETRSMEPNYCLIEKLRVSWGLDIPELTDPGEDESGIDLGNVLAAVRSALLRAKTLTFRVEETAHLALLQFSTLEMWRDLRTNWHRFMDRPVVRHLVETPGQPYLDNIEPPRPDPSAEATAYLPIPADGSQIAAARWAAAQKSFILEGPPGTGKSQTITNLIAHCMAEGKKVLFVAEKQAALDVVKNRLDAVGLGSLSLDLHGRNQTVASVRQQISDALDAVPAATRSWEAQRSHFRTLVEALDRYPRQLHEVGPVDISAWDARQVILELEEIVGESKVPQDFVPRAVVTGQVSINSVYEAARDLGSALLDLGAAPDTVPWRLAGPVNPATLDRSGVVRALQELRDADSMINDPAVHAMTDYATTPAEFDALGAWIDTFRAGTARTTSEASRIVSPAWRGQALQARNAVARFGPAHHSRLGPFRPVALDIDLDGLLARATEADQHLLGKRKRREAILASLSTVMHAPDALSPNQLTPALHGLIALRQDVHALRQQITALPGISLASGWNPLEPGHTNGLDRVIQGFEVAAHLRSTIGSGAGQVDSGRATVDQVTGHLLGSSDPRAIGTGDQIRRLGGAWTYLVQALGSTASDIARWLGDRNRGVALADSGQQWAADASGGVLIGLHRWLRVRFALARLEVLGLGSISEPVRRGILRGEDLENEVRLAVARATLSERLDATGLVGFDESERARSVERFVATGGDVRARMASELSARIVRARTFDPDSRTGMVSELRQQLGRRRGGMSVRRLLHQFAELVTQVTPCFLMSPASVARFLPADTIDFDVVVFDEASQIRVPEAIGAMGRARSVVIVGDSKQMPPSAMFTGSGATEDDNDVLDDTQLPVPVDLESILSEGVESRLPRLLLSWHYRSRDESLIAFSNERYYDRRLSSFPTPPDPHRESSVALRQVMGRWEGGGRDAARINRAEADAVVETVQELLAARPDQSIGVVTFNSQQRDHILNLLDEVRQHDGRVEEALSREDQPLFVKNLDNVQGDERDTVLFTLAFAADEKGKVPLNWGPLSRAGGERRLNVAVTRAKEQVIVFCSFEPHQLDLSRSTSQGLADLKDYLITARNGIEPVTSRRSGVHDRHLEDLQGQLRSAGLEVHPRVGLSDFTVDLAVRAGEDHAWIAVMLDGPAWADRESVGDREGLPAIVLTDRMGWAAVERVWLPTWVRDRASVVEQIVAAARSAIHDHVGRGITSVPRASDPDGSDQSQPLEPAQHRFHDHSEVYAARRAEQPPGLPDEPTKQEVWMTPIRGAASPVSPGAVSRSDPSDLSVFTPAMTDARHGAWVLDERTWSTRSTLRKEILDVIESEGPVLDERLARIVGARFDLSRVRESRREQILEMAPSELRTLAANGDVIYWPDGVVATTYQGFRLGADGMKRDIADVPYPELRNAMIAMVRAGHRVDHESTLRETARAFGVVRLGAKVRDRLEEVLSASVAEGHLIEKDGVVFER